MDMIDLLMMGAVCLVLGICAAGLYFIVFLVWNLIPILKECTVEAFKKCKHPTRITTDFAGAPVVCNDCGKEVN